MIPARSSRSIRLCTVVRERSSARANFAIGLRALARSRRSSASSILSIGILLKPAVALQKRLARFVGICTPNRRKPALFLVFANLEAGGRGHEVGSGRGRGQDRLDRRRDAVGRGRLRGGRGRPLGMAAGTGRGV